MAKKNIIVLNGKHYDTVSGVVVSHARPSHMVDSFVRVAPAADTQKSESISVRHVAGPARTTARSFSKSSKPQPAQTLMRHAVKKPSGLSRPPIKTQSAADSGVHIAVHTPEISLHKAASHTVDLERLERASHVAKPAVISRFNHGTPSAQATAAHPVPGVHAVSTFSSTPSPVVGDVAVEQPPVKPSQKLFEKALAESRSHEEVYTGPISKKSRRKQHAGFAALLVAVIMLAGFVAYLNVPNLTMSLASVRAGFHASMPGYLPSGFSVKHIGYQTGSVTTIYKSNSDSRTFNIVQKESDWDSSALVANYVAMTNQSYQTYQLSGRSVYIVGEGSATWVDGGVWYTVDSNGSLPTRQLLDIAAGL